MTIFKKAAAYGGGEMITVIGPEAFFHGSITVRGSIRIDGEMEGNIGEAQEVVIGKNGRVRGNISGERVEIGGHVTGDIVCSVHLEIKSTGRVLGNIRSPKMLIEDGAVFDGNCTMGADLDSEQPVAQVAAARGA